MAENEHRSSRMRASFERRRRENKALSNKAPYGLRVIAERDVAVPEIAPWVSRMFKQYAKGTGTLSLARIMRDGAPPNAITRSNPDGSTHTTIRSHKWDQRNIARSLRQRRYRGTIVPEKLFDDVQAKIKSRPRNSTKRVREYPLVGAIRCAVCKRGLQSAASGGRHVHKGKLYVYEKTRYYRCPMCEVRVNADALEASFRKLTSNLEAHPDLLRKWVARENEDDGDDVSDRRELVVLERRCSPQAVEDMRKRTWQPFYDGGINEEQLRAQLDAIEHRRSADMARLAELRSQSTKRSEHKRSLGQARGLLKNFWPIFDRAEYEKKRLLARTLAEALGGISVMKGVLVAGSA